MIHRTENVSFPRSGHHLLVNILKEYFGPEFRYCEYYSDYEHRLEVCKDTNYQKNHDFELVTPVLMDRQYVVQIRDPFEAITSLYELDRRSSKIGPVAENHLKYFSARWDFYNAFVKKWILDEVPNRIIVHYQELIGNPVGAAGKVICHVTKEPALDLLKLEAAVTAARVKPYLGIRRNCIFSPKDVVS